MPQSKTKRAVTITITSCEQCPNLAWSQPKATSVCILTLAQIKDPESIPATCPLWLKQKENP